MLLASVIGGYTLIGGLGATFYVSYFNTALIFILIIMLVAEVLFKIMQRFAEDGQRIQYSYPFPTSGIA